MNKIKLSKPWQSFVLTLSDIVFDNKKDLGVIDFESDPKEIKINGFGGEVAAAIFLNVCPDGEIRKHGNEYDLIYNNKKIDVKTTHHKKGKLITPLHKKPEKVDLFVFVIGEFPEYNIIGWLEANELFKKERIESLSSKKTPCYVAYQDELKSMKELKGEQQFEQKIKTNKSNTIPEQESWQYLFTKGD